MLAPLTVVATYSKRAATCALEVMSHFLVVGEDRVNESAQAFQPLASNSRATARPSNPLPPLITTLYIQATTRELMPEGSTKGFVWVVIPCSSTLF